ncbi:MAG: hypothetical protein QOI80_2253, partial [Solirubrobacteraceae bacterium]|nr:hypothetical protein [Solirubrobacteraceae bacterium]
MFFRSFRARLSWFFVVIVIFPIVMLTAVLFRLVADSEQGKSDARLAQAQTSASNLYRTTEARSAVAGRQIATSPALARALQAGDTAAILSALDESRAAARAAYAGLDLTSGKHYESGSPAAAAAAATEVGGAGTLHTAALGASGFAAAVRDLTGLDVVVSGPGFDPVGTLAAATRARLPERGERDLDDRTYRIASFSATGVDGAGRVTVRLLADKSETEGQTQQDRF